MIGNVHSGNMTRDHAQKSFSSYIARLAPNGDAPLFALSSMMKQETAVAFNHGYWLKSMVFPSVTTSVAAAIGDSVLQVASTGNVIPGMVFRVDGTGENVLCTGVNGTGAITVQRGFGLVAAAIIPITTLLIQIGNAQEEASLRPQPFTIQMLFDQNYTHIFRNTWAVSGSAAETRMIAGNGNVMESKQDCAALHAADIEKSFIFSQKYVGIKNGQLFHTMDGILSVLTQKSAANITSLGGTTNFTQLEVALDPVFNVRTDQMSSNDRIIFVGGVARRILNNIGRANGTYQMVDGQTGYGLQFSTFRTTRGIFRVIEHPLLNAFGPASSYARMGIILDMAALRTAYLGTRKTKAQDILGDEGIDAVGGTLTSELTLLITNPSACAILWNFTAAAAG